MAALAGIFKGMAAKTTKSIGNFWVYLTRSVTRILMPLSLLVGILLVINGTPMSFDGKQTLTTLGRRYAGDFAGTDGSHRPHQAARYERRRLFRRELFASAGEPECATNMLECWSILIIPMAMVFALGFYLKRRKLAACIFTVMLAAYTCGIVISVWQGDGGKSADMNEMGIAQELGSMEGKEIRIGSAASAMWGYDHDRHFGTVRSIPCTIRNASQRDAQMLNMQINCWFGGVGVGFMNYYALPLIIAVFISGTHGRGRTPEFLGKKVEAREMKNRHHGRIDASVPHSRRYGPRVVACRQKSGIGIGLAEQPVVPQIERNAVRVYLFGRQQRFPVSEDFRTIRLSGTSRPVLS